MSYENMKKKNNLKSLDQFVDEQYGEKGTVQRDKFEKGFEAFKLGFLLQQARLEKGLTQEELAVKCGTNKGYISKIENNIKEVRSPILHYLNSRNISLIIYRNNLFLIGSNPDTISGVIVCIGRYVSWNQVIEHLAITPGSSIENILCSV